MFATKLLVVLAAFLTFSGVDASGNLGVRDAVSRRCGAGQATFVIDGLSPEYAKDHLKNCPTDITLTFALGPTEIRSRQLIKLIKYAISQNHILAYRFHTDYDRKFSTVSPRRMVERLDQAKKSFKDLYDYDLRYVFFPYAIHHLSKQTEAVEDAGFTVFGNSIWIDKHFRKQSRSAVKKEIERVAKMGKGAIIYHHSENSHLHVDIDAVTDILSSNKFEIVNLDRCMEF